MRPKDERRGRVERGLDNDLVTRHDIRHAERAALRAQARAIDAAERNGDTDAVTKANSCYLDMRTAAGLSSGGSKPVDAVDALLAELLRPGAGASDMPNT